MNILRRLFKPNVAKMELEGNVPGLVKALQYPDQTIRYASTCALLRLGATEELAQIRPPVIDLLIQALADSDESIRWPAVTTLGRIGHPSAIEPLVAVLKDVDWEMRRAAAQALGQIGDVRAVEPLIAVLEDADGDVRRGAAQALGQIGDTRAVEPLVATLEDADSKVRQTAAEALDELDWKPSTALIGSLYCIAKREWRLCVQIGKPSVEPLIATLEDVDSNVRRGAAQALGQIGDTRATEPLIVILKDWAWEVRQAAAYALAQIGDARAVEPLIAVLQNTDSNVRRAVAQALGQIGDARAVEPLVAVLEDAKGNVRQSAAEALVQIGIPSVEPLIAVLQDADSNVRRAAAQALGQIGDTRAVEPLIAVLEDADSNVRWYAAYALGQIGNTRAVESLIAVLRREGTGVPWDIVGALRYFDIPQVNMVLKRLCGEALIACIEDNREVRDTIQPWLESTGFSVLWASDGVRGLELVRRVKPDLVLLDLEIPRMHGWEVCRRIRADNDLQDVLVLVMSASAPRVSHGRDLRVDGWLSKPFEVPRLLRAIEIVLAGREWE